MSINVSKPQSASFFVPVGIGVLVQMFCAGLLTAITAFAFTSPGERNTLAQSSVPTEIADSSPTDVVTDSPSIPKDESLLAASTEPAVTAEPNADAPLDTGISDPAANSGAQPASVPSEIAAAAGDLPAEAPPVAQGKPLDDVRNKSRVLPIAGEGVPEYVALCLIQAPDPVNVTLELLGGEFSAPQELNVQLDPPTQDEKSRIWSVRQVRAAGFDRTQDVGEFTLKDQQFSFRWKKDADKGKLPFCRLRISSDADNEVCDLWSAVHPPALRVSFSNHHQKLAAFVPPGIKLPPAELLQVELTFEGFPEHEHSGDKLVLDESIEIEFPQEESDRNLLKTRLTLKLEGGQLAVHASHSTTVPKPPSRSDKGEVKYSEKELSHKELEKFSRDAAATAAKYQKELNTIDKDLEKSRTVLDNLDRQSANNFSAALANEREIRERRIEEAEEQKALVSDLCDTFTEAETAMTKLTELCDDIEKKGRIHFRLIRSAEAPGSEIVISSSVDAAAEQAGRVP